MKRRPAKGEWQAFSGPEGSPYLSPIIVKMALTARAPKTRCKILKRRINFRSFERKSAV
jgi:hypothetical protein